MRARINLNPPNSRRMRLGTYMRVEPFRIIGADFVAGYDLVDINGVPFRYFYREPLENQSFTWTFDPYGAAMAHRKKNDPRNENR